MAKKTITKKIPLTQGKFALVNAEDYDFIMQWKWYADNTNRKNIWYAKANIPNAKRLKLSPVYMHRIIINAPKGKHVDHANHDTLDNRKCNLRICTVRQNRFNQTKREGFTSKYKGVSWAKHASKWVVFIKINRKNINLGYYNSEEEAAIIYNKEAKKLFGEFAFLNVL